MLRSLGKDERGQSLVIFAISATFLLAMVGLTIDGGHAFLQRRILQRGADNAARAAMTRVAINDYDAATPLGQTYAHDNGVPGSGATNVTIEYSQDGTTFSTGTPDGNTRYVRVTTDNPNFDTFFIGVVGIKTLSASARATAGLFSTRPTALSNMLPLAVPDTAPGTCLLWGPSNQCNDVSPSGGGSLGAQYKGLTDLAKCVADCTGYDQATDYGNKPADISQWTDLGCGCTIAINNNIELFTGDLGHNLSSPLGSTCTAQGLSDSGGSYGLFVVLVYNQVIGSNVINVSGFAQYRIHCKDISGSSASGSFDQWVFAGDSTPDSIAAAGYKGAVTVGLIE